MNNNNQNYIQGFGCALKSLATGLKTTMCECFTKKITEQYPENRNELQMFDRFRGSLVMPHNENNEHKCIACTLCQTNCPNDTIDLKIETVEVDGKKKKQLVAYNYDLGSCMFCMICVRVCPQNAITFDQSFENAVFDRSKLIQQLNQPGSKCEEKKPVAKAASVSPKPATATAASPNTAKNQDSAPMASDNDTSTETTK